jgi:hypothetical protein
MQDPRAREKPASMRRRVVFPGAVGAREHQRGAVVDAQVDVAEHRLRVPHAGDVVEEEPRRPKRPHQRSLALGR